MGRSALHPIQRRRLPAEPGKARGRDQLLGVGWQAFHQGIASMRVQFAKDIVNQVDRRTTPLLLQKLPVLT